MKYYNCALIIGLIILSVCIAGCTSNVPSIQPSENKLSTLEPSEMALQPSDIPGNFSLKERSERVGADIDQWARDHGWKKGYTVKYQKIDLNSFSGTGITQTISIYAIENISQVIPELVKEIKKPGEEKITVDELSDPNIGDSSMAFRFTKPGIDTKEYLIIFVKKDVYEQLDMSGSVTDYESLKQLASIAAAKIK